jgi:transposase, IS6 family
VPAPGGNRWWVEETYVKVSGRWRYVYRPIDQFGQVIDVYVSTRRDGGAASDQNTSGDHASNG